MRQPRHCGTPLGRGDGRAPAWRKAHPNRPSPGQGWAPSTTHFAIMTTDTAASRANSIGAHGCAGGRLTGKAWRRRGVPGAGSFRGPRRDSERRSWRNCSGFGCTRRGFRKVCRARMACGVFAQVGALLVGGIVDERTPCARQTAAQHQSTTDDVGHTSSLWLAMRIPSQQP